MIIEIIILSVFSLLILFFRKGSLNIKNINIEVRGYKILIAMAVVEIIAVFLFKFYKYYNTPNIVSVNWLIYPAILIITILNFKNHYMKLFFIGTLMNFIAIVSNDFKMPVYISEIANNSQASIMFLSSGQDLIHSLMTDTTKFKILCDIILLPPPYPFVKTISIGDIFLLSGMFLIWQESYISNNYKSYEDTKSEKQNN